MALTTTTNYYTVNGDILGEKATGTSRLDYLTDALGSVTGTLDQSAAVVNTYRYKPYGAQLAKTGVGADPAFGFVGSQGYRNTGRTYSDMYVRARHLDSTTGRWTTVDPLWPEEEAYIYIWSTPSTYTDFSGMQVNSSEKIKSEPQIGEKDRRMPPDCSKLSKKTGKRCEAVYFTCNDKTKTKHLAVYCLPTDLCANKHYYRREEGKLVRCKPTDRGAKLRDVMEPCNDVCNEYGKRLAQPIFDKGKTVCIYGIHGPTTRKIDDCGCGQYVDQKPQPDHWMDWEGESCKGFDDGWRCVCDGPCVNKKKSKPQGKSNLR